MVRSEIAAQRRRLQRLHERNAVHGRAKGVVQVRLEDLSDGGAEIVVGGKRILSFGTCSYLALNDRPELVEAAIAAVARFGVTYSSSIAYSRLELYDELEAGLSRMTGGEVVVTPSTTLAHLSALPVIVGPDDLVVVDAQAHASVHLATDVLAADGIEHTVVPHADLTALAGLLEAAGERRIWYLADGIYSMYGDEAPLDDLAGLLAEHQNLYAYIDDAHGFSWEGRDGSGFALSRLELSRRLVVAVSLSKSFGGGGGGLIFGDPDLAERVRLVGGPLTFGGPLQVAELAAGAASTRIHLSEEHPRLRSRLHDQIRLVSETCERLGLPLASHAATPIWFVPVGPADAAFEIAASMRRAGFYVNPSAFPAVPFGRAGIRFTHTLHHTDEQIVGMLDRLSRCMDEVVPQIRVTIDLTERSSIQAGTAAD